MVGRIDTPLAGTALGLAPAALLTSAATGSMAWAMATITLLAVGAAVLLMGRLRGHLPTHRTVGAIGLAGGIALAAANLFYPVGPTAFPGGTRIIWLLAMTMVGCATPILWGRRMPEPVRRRHPQLRTIRIIEDRGEPVEGQ